VFFCLDAGSQLEHSSRGVVLYLCVVVVHDVHNFAFSELFSTSNHLAQSAENVLFQNENRMCTAMLERHCR